MADPLDLLAGDAGLDVTQPVAGADLLADPNAPGPFARGVKSGVAGVKGSLYGMGALAARGAANVLPAAAAPVATGLEQAALENVAAQNEIASQGAMSFEDVVADPSRAGEYFKFLLGNAVPSLAAMATGGGIGAGIGALAARGSAAALTARALGAVAPAVRTGALVGAVAPDFALEAGSIYPEALKTGVENPALRSVAGGAAAAALDFIPLLAAEKYLKPIGAGGIGALAKGALKGAPVGAALEGTQEALQSVVERGAAGNSLTDPAAVSDYINSFAGGAAPGAMFGAGIGARRQSVAPAAVPPVAETAPIVPDSGMIVPDSGTPAPASITPEALHADLTAQHAAATQQVTDHTALLGTLQQAQAEGEAKIKALAAEAKLPPGERRIKSEILAEKKDMAAQVKEVKAKIEEVGGQLNAARTTIGTLTPQLEAARQALPPAPLPEGTVPDLVQPEITPRAAPVVSDIIADPNLPPPTPAEQTDRAVKGVHALFREQGMPLTTTEESLATPPQTPREVALAKVEQRQPRESVPQASPAQMQAIEANAMSVIEPLAKTMAATKTKTPEAQAKVAAKLAKAMRGVVQEAAKQGSIEAAQQYVTDKLPNALKGHGVTADATDMAKAVNAGVGLARTLYSKGATKPATEVSKEQLGAAFGYFDPSTGNTYVREDLPPAVKRFVSAHEAHHATQDPEFMKKHPALAEIAASVFPGFKDPIGLMATMKASLTPERLKFYLDRVRGEQNSRAALTQDEFDALPEPAQFAAVDAYNRVMRAKGTALRQRMAQLIGDRPELKIMTFSATPDSPIGSYTRTGPLKAAISMALNAKEGLSVADHEGYHFAEDWLLTPGERRVAANALKAGKPLYTQLVARLQQYDRENGTSLTDEVTAIPAEARAYAFEFWRRGEFKADGALAKAWQKIKTFFERIVNAVNGLGFQSIEDVFVALDRGQMAEREMVAGDGGAFQSVAGGQSWYRSALTEAVAGIQSRQATAQGWKDQIKGLIANGKAKQVELDAVGLNEWLDLQQGKVTKDQVMAFLGENGVQVRETILGSAMPQARQDEYQQRLRDIEDMRDLGGRISHDEARRQIDALQQEFKVGEYGDPFDSTKFAAYQLPGGENYRELLLTLPAKQATQFFIAYKGDSTMGTGFATRQEAEAELADTFPGRNDLEVREGTGDRSTTTRTPENFRSSHFDQPNILAHIRFNERTGAEGKRVLFIEEIQSDWAQKGRKEGFASAAKPLKDITTEELRGILASLPQPTAQERAENYASDYEASADAIFELITANRTGELEGYDRIDRTSILRDVLVGDHNWTEQAANTLQQKLDGYGAIRAGTPSAPFVTKTEAWTALALKRMIRYAAENGFDSIAWTTGEQQAARYDLSKQVDHVAHYKDGSGHLRVAVQGMNGEEVWNAYDPTPKELEDTLGKEIAGKIANDEGADSGAGVKILRGLDLKVGGEGMKGYYDKIVVGVANDILKKLGGGKVGEVTINQDHDASQNTEKEWDEGVARWHLKRGGEIYVVDKNGMETRIKNELTLNAELDENGAPRGYVLGDTQGSSTQPGFTITPRLAENAANGLPLFSKAAVAKANRMAAGELEAMQSGEQYAHLIENANLSNDLFTRAFGVVKEDIVGGLGRWWTNTMSTPNYISAASAGFKNVYQAFNTYSRYRKILAEQLVRERLPSWYQASDADRKAAFDVMLKRTVGKFSTNSLELADLLRTLTPQQRTLYDQATGMIAGVLQRQFESQKVERQRQLTSPGAYDKWLAHRQEQMASLLDTGYVPLRRYGDYSVSVYMEAPDGSRVQAGLEFFASPSAAKAASIAYAREIERSGVALKVEMGRRSKNERDTGVSLEQFLGTLRRQGVDISQAERERLVVAMTNADSLVRTQMMRREGLAGYSTDGMRVLHEFGVNTTSEIAYARFAPVLDAALDGAEVTADVNSVTSEPVIQIGEAFGRREDGVENNLWKRDGPMSGFYKDRANAMADTTLSPDRQSEWATKLRTAGVMYFIGGSISGAAVNTLSIPMVLVPRLSLHTDYLNASMTSLKAWKDSWQHYNVLRDMDRMKNPDAETAAKLDAAGITKEMRASIVAAADHIFDTEIHQMLGISQGSLYSKSRNVQRAAEAWMAPFRVAEQTNRLASFIAAYKVATTGDGVKQADGTFKRLSGQELFRFAGEMVDATQNNYNACVDTDTECLTEKGWRRYDGVKAGDTLYGVDHEGGLVETIARQVNVFPGAQPILRFRNGRKFEMVVTENHDCVVQNYNSRDKKWQKVRKVPAGHIKHSHHMLRSPLHGELARAETYSDAFVELLGWVASEGSYGKLTTPGQIGDVKISQSRSHNPQYVIAIESLLQVLGMKYRRYDNPHKEHPSGRPHDMVTFTIQAPDSWRIREALPDKRVTPAFVRNLTTPQMALFLASFTQGDGHIPLVAGSGPVITQKSQETIDALQMMATLAGVTSTTHKAAGLDWHTLYLGVASKRSHMRAMQVTKGEVDTVWCPTTGCGTWIARRNGRVFVTGNSNRPGIMNNPVGALMFQFKSFPLFIIEAAALMYKQSPKSAVYMLLGLVAMSGVQGLPFAEEILNLVDVISQRLFGSPFNSRRAMRNAIKTASDAVGVMDLSNAVMRGMVNEITGVNIATRVSGGLLPGTRIGAADATEGRVLSEIAGAPFSMVQDTMSNVGGFVSGVATGDWQKAADALRAGGPIAVRNAVKGAEQLSQGYASDSKGRKVADVSTVDGLLQLTGLSSAAVQKMNDMQSIIIQTKAFHTQVNQDMQNRLVKAYRDGDQERIRETLDFAAKWNEQNPAMPILPNPSALRRQIALAGMPLNRREQVMLGRRLGGAFADVTDQMAE
ncbi:MAG: PLxRFG domain-containing protein [Gallionella sp.]|nr:PLxRFG domain-containing protein [Gallionella sp.]